jgi:hypothetical protein
MTSFKQWVAGVALLCLAAGQAMAADMTVQIINNTERALSLKLFSNGESGRHWPGKSRAYSLKPGTDVQELKIDCEAGEQVCWGAWVTVESVGGQISDAGSRSRRVGTYQYGVGQKNPSFPAPAAATCAPTARSRACSA